MQTKNDLQSSLVSAREASTFTLSPNSFHIINFNLFASTVSEAQRQPENTEVGFSNAEVGSSELRPNH